MSSQTWGSVRIFQPNFERDFFQNLNFFHFFWHIFWLLRRTLMIFLLTERSGLVVPLRYPEHARKPHRKISKDFEGKVSAKSEVLSKYSNSTLSCIFSKLQLFSLFPIYNLIGSSCGHNIFTAETNEDEQIFQTWKRLYILDYNFYQKVSRSA